MVERVCYVPLEMTPQDAAKIAKVAKDQGGCPFCAAGIPHGTTEVLFSAGDKVSDVQDDRHVGTLQGIVFGNATIVWDDTGWKSIIPRARLRHAE